MKKLFMLLTALCLCSLSMNALEQDYEVYNNEGLFVVRGTLDLQEIISSHDAAEAIQGAIDRLPSSGGEVILHRGIYPLSKTVQLKSAVWLHGKGRGSILQVLPENDTGIALLCKGLKGTHISDLRVVPLKPRTGLAGIVLDDCGDCQVRNTLCQGFSGYGIWLRNNSFLCEVSSCQLADNGKANIFCQNLFSGGRGGDFLPNLISDCTIYGGGHGIECDRTIVLNIIGCIVFQSEENGFYLHSGSNSVLISGSRTFQIEKHAVVIENTHEANISSNIFCWHRGNGILITGSAWATVSANNIIDSGVRTRDGSYKSGLVIRDSCRAVLVSGNNIFNWGDQVPMLHGIEEDATCYNNQFVANNINYFTGTDVVSMGSGSLVENNVSSGPKAFVSDGKPPYPDFNMESIKRFLKE